jgi:hypothetical protein
MQQQHTAAALRLIEACFKHMHTQTIDVRDSARTHTGWQWQFGHVRQILRLHLKLSTVILILNQIISCWRAQMISYYCSH